MKKVEPLDAQTTDNTPAREAKDMPRTRGEGGGQSDTTGGSKTDKGV